jgi:hypothetical protein
VGKIWLRAFRDSGGTTPPRNGRRFPRSAEVPRFQLEENAPAGTVTADRCRSWTSAGEALERPPRHALCPLDHQLEIPSELQKAGPLRGDVVHMRQCVP